MKKRQEVQGFVAQIEVEPDGDGFHAFCQELRGLHVWGNTQAEAILNATDGAEAYLNSLTKHGDPIPLHTTGCTAWRFVQGRVPLGHWRCDCKSSSTGKTTRKE